MRLPGILKRLQRLWSKGSLPKEEEPDGPKENPYLPYIREILGQVLLQKGLEYGQMRLLVIDTDQELESIFWEDNVLAALADLSEDLNFLTILTDRAAYFQEYVETMYEENGLLVCVEEKQAGFRMKVNAVLDFEQEGKLWNLELPEPSVYLPVYKKSWEAAENLDIYVPIGYNIMIVKGILAVEKRGRVL